MACNHPRDRWVGMSDGIHCADCGALIDLGKKPEPVKAPEPKDEAPEAEPKDEAPEPEPEKKAEPKKAAPKKGGKK